MIKEEFSFYDVADYLYEDNELIIVGEKTIDERSYFFFDEWNKKGKAILKVSRTDNERLKYTYVTGGEEREASEIDLCVETPVLLRHLKVDKKSVLLDMSSLDHILIMFLTKVLVKIIEPRALFASYIRPQKYINQVGNVGFSLSNKVMAIEAVPGFAKRECEKQTLCAFLGFEGVRLKSILETVHNMDRFIPVVAFPSGTPQWYNVAMWNSMDTLQSECTELSTCKCFSESIFDAVEILQRNITPDERAVLAPLGTRPHSMACALFACKHPHTRIIYDYAVECQRRAIGIAEIKVYHLTMFLEV